MSEQHSQTNSIRVWDPLLRIFHWTLVLAFMVAMITEDDWMNLHIAAGELVAWLLAFRVLWGLIGTRYARFSQFIRSPASVIDYLKHMLTRRVPHYLGHNPAAAAMIVALLSSLLMVSLTGYIMIAAEGQGIFAGTFLAGFNPGWMEEVHEFFANFTLLLVFAHVGGVIVSSLLEKQNLVRSMLTGLKKYRSDYVDFSAEK